MSSIAQVTIFCFVQAILVTNVAFAQAPDQTDPVTDPVVDAQTIAVVPAQEGKPAKFTGLLLTEEYFTELLEADLQLDLTKGELRVEKKYSISLETMYKKQLDKALKPTPWYKTPSFNRWLGFSIGVVVTGFAVWGATEIVKANDS